MGEWELYIVVVSRVDVGTRGASETLEMKRPRHRRQDGEDPLGTTVSS